MNSLQHGKQNAIEESAILKQVNRLPQSSLPSLQQSMCVCEERVHCFVHGQAEQQFLLCVHLSPLSILLRLCMQNATSDSLMAFTLIPFPVIILLGGG